MSIKEQLDYLFNPCSVAVIGASNALGKWGCNILNQLLTKGGRPIYAINKNGGEVLGLKAYRSIQEVPEPVDFAVITVPFMEVPAAMEDCALKEVKAALVISGGLAETGGEGARIEKKVTEIARQSGIRFVGPNCMGHFDTYSNLFTVPFIPHITKGPVALISQSGNSAGSVLNAGRQMGLGFSKFVSSGNEADLHFEDYLEYLAQDDKTDVILGYIEGIREGRRFMELAKEITKRKPIVIMKTGRTEAGAKAAQSHTASLSGSDVVCDAAFKQCGVIRVDEVNELIDVALALLGQPLPRGRRVGVLSMGGGMAVTAADTLMRKGLELPSFSSSTFTKLNSILSSRWSHGNPIDPGGDAIIYPCLWALLEDENIDALLVIGGVGMVDSFSGWISAPSIARDELDRFRLAVQSEELKDLDRTIELTKMYQKPMLLATLVSGITEKGEIYKKLEQQYLTPYPTLERASKALALLVNYAEYLGLSEGVAPYQNI